MFITAVVVAVVGVFGLVGAMDVPAYLIVDVVRLFLMKQMLGFPPTLYVRNVFFRISLVTIFAIPLPLLITQLMDQTIFRFFVNAIVCVLVASFLSFFLGLSKNERIAIQNGVKSKILRK